MKWFGRFGGVFRVHIFRSHTHRCGPHYGPVPGRAQSWRHLQVGLAVENDHGNSGFLPWKGCDFSTAMLNYQRVFWRMTTIRRVARTPKVLHVLATMLETTVPFQPYWWWYVSKLNRSTSLDHQSMTENLQRLGVPHISLVTNDITIYR